MIPKMKIPKFKLKFDEEFIKDYQDIVWEILNEPRPISNGYFVKGFETEFAEAQRVKHAVAVGSGTDALEVALRTIGVEGKEVIVPVNTMIGTAIAVERAGGIIKFWDIDYNSLTTSVEGLANYIDNNIVGAVIMVHIGGINPTSEYVHRLKEACNHVPIIEDAAQAVLSPRAGQIGELACFSFSATKIMTTGEGGMVTTNMEDLVDKMRTIRNFGTPPGMSNRTHVMAGGNFKMTEFQAGLGICELLRVDGRVKRRQSIVDAYHINLTPDSGEKHEIYPFGHWDGSAYKCVVILPNPEDTRLKFKLHMAKYGVSLTGEVYENPLHHVHYYYKEHKDENYPNAELFCRSHVCLPNYPEMTDDEVRWVIAVALAYWYGEKYIEETYEDDTENKKE